MGSLEMGINMEGLTYSLLVAFSLLNAAFASDWNYGSEGPSTWSEHYPTCGGSSQSPINIGDPIITSKIPCKLEFSKAYSKHLKGSWKNNGHSLQFTLDDESASKTQLKGQYINSTYQLAQVHFHWGSKAEQGSEHTFQGKQSSLEMHAFHLNTQYEMDDAGNHPDGYLVVGILFNEFHPMTEFDPIHKLLGKYFQRYIKLSQNAVEAPEMKAKFSVEPFLAMSNVAESHYQYHGSLTTPGCNESVTWVLAPKILGVTPRAMKFLRQLKTDDGEPLVNNFRPVQDLNGREI